MAEAIHRPAWHFAVPADRYHYDEQMDGGEMGEKEERTGSRAMKRDGKEEAKVVRSSLTDVQLAIRDQGEVPLRLLPNLKYGLLVLF